jgi:hypothetical protein
MSTLTEKGLLSDRPEPSTNPAGYYYATDEGKYYKSNGDTWLEISTDFEDIDPRTEIRLMAGLDQDGTIDTVKLVGGALNVASTNVPGFNIPKYDKIQISYYTETSNISSIEYLSWDADEEEYISHTQLNFQYNNNSAATPRLTSIEIG